MINQTRICNNIALHDFNHQNINWKDLHNYSLSLFSKYGFKPNKLLVTGTHYGNSSKPKGFKSGLNKLEKFNFEGIKSLSYSLLEPKADDVSNYIIDIYISARAKDPYDSTIIFSIDKELEPFKKGNFESVAVGLFNLLKSQYGYYYTMLLKDWPGSYATGGSSYSMSDEERRRCDLWEEATFYKKIYKTGDLRDIYKLNFLSREHLIRDVRSSDQHSSGAPITLEAWINSSPEHGELKQLREGFWSWYVPDEHIESVRELLIPSGIILCV